MATAATSITDAVRAVLAGYLSSAVADGVLQSAFQRTGSSIASLDRDGLTEALVKEMRPGLELFLQDEARRRECVTRLTDLLPARSARFAPANAKAVAARVQEFVRPQAPVGAPPASTVPRASAAWGAEPIRPIEVAIIDENGIVDARTRARSLAASLGFSTTDQYKLATAVSEVARNIFRYAGKGKVSFGPVTSPRPGMFVVARDDGPGIPDIAHVLSENYVSKTGLGRGLQGSRRIMDEFEIDSAPGRGTIVSFKKFLLC